MNAADADQIKKAESQRKLELEDIRFVLSHRQGRAFVWRYLEECGIFKTSFTGNSQTFFNEGMRNIGLKLLAEINLVAPEVYPQMLQESKGDSNA